MMEMVTSSDMVSQHDVFCCGSVWVGPASFGPTYGESTEALGAGRKNVVQQQSFGLHNV